MKRIVYFLTVGFLLVLIGASVSVNAADTAPEKTKICFNCNGKGNAKCPEPTCRNGRMDCPGPCLKLSKGVWEKRNIAGHTDPNERWQKVRYGTKTGYWSSAHAGEVPTMLPSGEAASPKCTVCSGAAAIGCTKCKGSGTTACGICDGKKTVPESWSAFDHPKLKTRPQKFTLKDGRTIIGRKTMISGKTVTLRTADGDVKVSSDEIVSEISQPATK